MNKYLYRTSTPTRISKKLNYQYSNSVFVANKKRTSRPKKYHQNKSKKLKILPILLSISVLMCLTSIMLILSSTQSYSPQANAYQYEEINYSKVKMITNFGYKTNSNNLKPLLQPTTFK